MSQSTITTESPPRGWLSTRWLRFVLAVTFLTRLPLPIKGDVTPADLKASMGWYPAVGLALGAVGWAIYASGSQAFSPLVGAVLAIVLLEACSGALHLDGLMDTCDGIGSGRSRERMLEIMKDSRVGAMGVFGAIAVILVKVTALAALTPSQSLPVLLIGWMASRAVPIWAVTLFPYARKTGTGGMFIEGHAPHALLFATIVALGVGFLIAGQNGLLLAELTIVFPLLVSAYISRKLGGLTGDVYGMGIEIGETLSLLAMLVLMKHCLIECPVW
ncbi:MAG: adenosylcobinamide-GDP ribazoletransferase [Armatimonadota bacterium]